MPFTLCAGVCAGVSVCVCVLGGVRSREWGGGKYSSIYGCWQAHACVCVWMTMGTGEKINMTAFVVVEAPVCGVKSGNGEEINITKSVII